MTPAPQISPDQITIAITVFDRRRYLHQAIRSALEQTVPVRVVVVEDHGPDQRLEAFVRDEFGSRIEYRRNPVRRGLFGNWNACVEDCPTPWLSILHDDDYLDPGFVEAMIALADEFPGHPLYFGQTMLVNEQGAPLGMAGDRAGAQGRKIELADMVFITPFPFAGQLFQVEAVRAAGGFRETSQYCGDWEMWARLALHDGAAESGARVAFSRSHAGWDRGTNAVMRAGKLYPLSFVQHKRVLRLLRSVGKPGVFERRAYLKRFPVSSTMLFRLGGGFTPRLLHYHLHLLWMSPSLTWRHWIFKRTSRVLGPRFVRWVSGLRRLWPRQLRSVF